MRPTLARVDLSALRENYRLAAQRARGRSVIAVLKADAYGHGAVAVARCLEAEGCARFAVLSVAEAEALRRAGSRADLLVLAGVHDADEARACLALGAVPVVHHAGHVELVARAAGAAAASVQVEIDTGMCRMGAPPERAVELLEAVAANPRLRLDGVFTHLARADERDLSHAREQLQAFRAVLADAAERGVRARELHAANSAALLCDELESEFPEASAVRPGLLLYGAQPRADRALALRPVLSLRTQVVAVRRIAAGTPVGYGGEYRARRPTAIATLAVGYADGVPVASSGRGSALIGGRRLPFAGRVSMDYVIVVAGDEPIAVGDEALLFGRDAQGEIPVEEAAAIAGTHAYELLVRVGARVPREYVE
jgi:alanine racemase